MKRFVKWWDAQSPGVRIGVPWALFVLAIVIVLVHPW